MRTVTPVCVLFLSFAVCAAAEEQPVRVPVVFEGTVDRIVTLAGFTGKVIPVHFDPEFVVTVTVKSCLPETAGFDPGRSVSFAIHSPSQLFRTYEERIGSTFTFTVSREVDGGKVKYSNLTVLKKVGAEPGATDNPGHAHLSLRSLFQFARTQPGV